MFNFDETEKAKVKAFLLDKVMSATVRKVLVKAFMKPRGDKDIHTLAASRLAIDFLEEGFRELERLKSDDTKPTDKLSNPGL